MLLTFLMEVINHDLKRKSIRAAAGICTQLAAKEQGAGKRVSEKILASQSKRSN